MMRYKKATVRNLKNPFPYFWIEGDMPPLDKVNQLEELLNTDANENRIQVFLENNPLFLSQMLWGHHGHWVIPKPKFGSEYIPDFIIGDKDSTGFRWILIELENPNKKVLTKNGQQTSQLSQAIRQINSWRIWLRKNISYARNELGFIDIDSEILSLIFIGRRKYINDEQRELYRQLSNEKLKIMSYDRLLYDIL